MTMVALAFSPDFCIVAADKAVGEIVQNGRKVLLPRQAVKIKYSTTEPMPYIATAAGFSQAVEHVSNYDMKSPGDIVQLGDYLALEMKTAMPQAAWVNEYTSSFVLALYDNKFYTRGFYLNDEVVLFQSDNPISSVIPAGLSDPNLAARKAHWERNLTEAITPQDSTRTPLERLNDTLAVMTDAFSECASIDNFVSSSFDYCVLTKDGEKITLNSVPTGTIFG